MGAFSPVDYLGHKQKAGLEMEQQVHELLPIGDADATGQRLT